MKIRAAIACLCVLSGNAAPVAWADAASKATKIAELLQLTGARQFLHEVDGKFDQEEAVRAWGRYYSENVTEGDLDAILAYYRSPAGQKDVGAARAALPQVQRYMVERRAETTAPTAAAAASPGGSNTPLSNGTGQGTGQGTVANTPGAGGVGPGLSAAAPPRPWDSAPLAPDGRVIPGSSLPERCEVTPSTAPDVHAVPPSGRSVVCVCTDEKGALTRDPVIAESSGDARVDSGAIKMARVDSGRYIPPKLDGRPQSACFRFAIDFRRHQ